MRRWLLVSTMVGIGCNQIAGLSDYTFEETGPTATSVGTGGGGGGGVPSGGGGSAPSCTTPTDCGVSTTCRTFTCEMATCGSVLAAPATACSEGGVACNGLGECVSGAAEWSLSLDGAGTCRGLSVDPTGNIYVTTRYGGPFTLPPNDTPVPHVDEGEVLVARFSPTGERDWLVVSDATGEQTPRDITATPDGTSVVVGEFDDTLDFGTPTLTKTGSLTDGFVVAFAPSNGARKWQRHLDDAADNTAIPLLVETTPTGNVVVAGFFGNSLDDLGLTTTETVALFVTELDADDGSVLWATEWNASAYSAQITGSLPRPRGMTIDDEGNIYVAGGIGVGGDVVQAEKFLVKLDAAGEVQLDAVFPATSWSFNWFTDIVAMQNGMGQPTLFVLGNLRTETAVGTGTLVPTSSGTDETYWLRLDPSAGYLDHRVAGAWAPSTYGAVGPDGQLVVAGEFQNQLDLFDAPFSNNDTENLFVGKADAELQNVYSRSFGASGALTVGGMEVDENGNILLCGSFGSQLALGSPTLFTSTDAFFLAKLAP